MAHTSRRLLVGIVVPVVLLSAGCGGGGGNKTLTGAEAAEAAASSAEAALKSLVAEGPASAGISITPAAAASASASAAGSSSAGATSGAVASGSVASGSAAPSPVPTAAAAGSGSQVSVRFVNLFTTATKQPGPALDIYDTQQGLAAKPVVTDVAYGAVSAYVHPQATNGVTEFYAMPTGEDPVAKQTDAKGLGGLQDDGSHPQETIRLTGDPGSIEAGPLAGLSFSTIVEKGSDNGSKAPVAPPAPAGQGELLVDVSAFQGLVPSTNNFLLIDTSCAPPLNGDHALGNVPAMVAVDGEAPVSNFVEFATTPGTHQVSVDIDTSDTEAPCAQLTAKQGTTSVTVAAGQQVLAFLYGTSPTDAHLVFAPIAP